MLEPGGIASDVRGLEAVLPETLQNINRILNIKGKLVITFQTGKMGILREKADIISNIYTHGTGFEIVDGFVHPNGIFYSLVFEKTSDVPPFAHFKEKGIQGAKSYAVEEVGFPEADVIKLIDNFRIGNIDAFGMHQKLIELGMSENEAKRLTLENIVKKHLPGSFFDVNDLSEDLELYLEEAGSLEEIVGLIGDKLTPDNIASAVVEDINRRGISTKPNSQGILENAIKEFYNGEILTDQFKNRLKTSVGIRIIISDRIIIPQNQF